MSKYNGYCLWVVEEKVYHYKSGIERWQWEPIPGQVFYSREQVRKFRRLLPEAEYRVRQYIGWGA